jgi:hypothetical protein
MSKRSPGRSAALASLAAAASRTSDDTYPAPIAWGATTTYFVRRKAK